jgi:hypothetical protein
MDAIDRADMDAPNAITATATAMVATVSISSHIAQSITNPKPSAIHPNIQVPRIIPVKCVLPIKEYKGSVSAFPIIGYIYPNTIQYQTIKANPIPSNRRVVALNIIPYH